MDPEWVKFGMATFGRKSLPKFAMVFKMCCHFSRSFLGLLACTLPVCLYTLLFKDPLASLLDCRSFCYTSHFA